MRVSWQRAALATAWLLSASAASAAPEERLAVIAGANVGGPEDELLRYAEADANRFRDVLVELGDVRPDRAIVSMGGSPEQLLQALTEARGRAAEIQRSGSRVVLLFYYSGHGDEDGLHLPRGTMPLSELRAEMNRIPADLRIAILDACRSSGKSKGVRRGPEFDLAIAPDSPHGTVEIRASSSGEAAQESEELGGAVFTHFLLSGLRGAADSDGDGRVTLAELYAYAYRRTLFRSGTGPALQHPTIAEELAGAGEVVLTRPARASATLEVPPGRERYLIFATPSAAVLGEMTGDETLRLALPPGRFLVARHSGNATSVATVDLSWGGHRRLTEKDFQPISREELALRGGRIELRARRVEPRLGVEFGPGSELPVALRTGAALAFSHGELEWGMEVAYLGGPSSIAGWQGTEQAITGGPSLGFRQFFGRWTLLATLGIELRYSWQRLERLDRQRVEQAGFGATEARTFGSIGPRAGLQLALPLGHHLTGSLGVSAIGLFRREEAAPGSAHTAFRPAAFITAAVGYAF
jgi:hypothetical protein